MLVREIMTAPALYLSADATLDEALGLLAEQRISAIPIVSQGQQVVGIVSELDVLRRAVEPDDRAHEAPVAESEPLPRTVGEIMTSDPTTTTEGADVADLVEIFTSTSFKSLPVVRGSELVGIVSRGDVIRALWRDDQELHDDLVSAFHDYDQDTWTITVKHGVVRISGESGPSERAAAAAIARSIPGVRRVQVTAPQEA